MRGRRVSPALVHNPWATDADARVWLRAARIVMTRELRAHCADAVVWTTVVLAAVLSILCTALAAESYAIRMAGHAELLAQRERDRSRLEGGLTGVQVEPALRAIRQPEPLSAVITGLDAAVPPFWDFGPAGVRTGFTSDDPESSATSPIDIRYVVTVVLGILSIILALNCVAGERADGSLIALLGQAVQPSAVIGGKLAAGTSTLAMATTLVMIAAATTMAIRQPSLIGAETLAMFGLLSISTMLYLLVVFAAGLLISSLFGAYRTTLVITVVFWVLNTLIVSSFAALVARLVTPTSPLSVVEAHLDDVARATLTQTQLEMGDVFAETAASGATAEGGYGADRATLQRMESIWHRHITSLRAMIGRLEDQRHAVLERRVKVKTAISRFSPAAVYFDTAAALSGVGEAAAARWRRAVAVQQARLEESLFDDRPRLTVQSPTTALGIRAAGRALVSIQRHPPPHLTDLPAFRPPVSGGRRGIADALAGMATLTVYAVLLVGFAARAFTRIRL